jgi:hypothetical protein
MKRIEMQLTLILTEEEYIETILNPANKNNRTPEQEIAIGLEAIGDKDQIIQATNVVIKEHKL